MRKTPLAAWTLGLLCVGWLSWGTAPAQAAVGGGQTTTTTFSSSTTSGTTYTRKDLPTIQAYRTRVMGYAYVTGEYEDSAWVYDKSFNSQASSAEVQSAFATCRTIVENAASSFPGREYELTISGPTLEGSGQTSNTAYLGNEVDHTEQSVTTTAAFGPTSILIGDEQSQTFFVAAGTVNYNTNTHTQTFMNQLYQTTVTNQETYQITGHKVVSPIVLNMDGSGKLQASGGRWQPHPERFNVDRRAFFDFYGNGFPVAMEWVGPADGLLCQPKADGSVDGSCLFGTATGYESGFEQLSSLDANMDLKVDGKELAGLMVWQDANSNARAEQNELKSVQDLGITELSLKQSKQKSTFVMQGKTCTMFDWWPTTLTVKKVKYTPSV